MLDNKSQLSITLTEPVIFLRSFDPSGRHFNPNDPPTVVRGVLSLNVIKPIGVSSIDVELSGTLTTYYSDGVATRPIDIQEKHKIYSSTVNIFLADDPHGKRPAFGGPSLSAQNATNGPGDRAAINLSYPGSERPGTVSLPPDLGPTPPYSPMPQSPNRVQSGLSSSGEVPGDMLEELGQALRDNLEDRSFEQPRPRPSRPHSIPFCHSNSTAHSAASVLPDEPLLRESGNPPSAGGTSFPSSTEELSIPLHRPRSHHSCPRRNNPDFPSLPPARSRFRLSIDNVLDAVMEVASRARPGSRGIAGSEEGERGRTRDRTVANEHSRESTRANEGIADTGNRQPPRTNTSPSGHERHLLSRVLGLERDGERENDSRQKFKDRVEGWTEFNPGTYSYPISFLLPSNLPPTFSVPRGSLNYVIKAVAHRPGTFTSKLSCRVPLLVVAAPTTGAGEGGVPGDPGPVNIERQWEGKLAYSFDLSSRLFLLGSQRHLGAAASDAICANTESSVEATVAEARAEAVYGTSVLNLTLLPLEKIKIWKLSIVVDQHIRYFDEQKRFRDEDRRQVKLLDVQDKCLTEELVDEESTRKNKHAYVQIPLLPTPISPDRSPLMQHISPSADPSILAGPGPYTISTSIGLPRCGDRGLRFSMKHKGSYVKVEHLLRLVARVENVSDESTNGREEAKKKFFDVTVQTPITVLSCRCITEPQTLPVYSLATEDCLVCPCQPSSVGPGYGQGYEAGNEAGHLVTSNVRTSSESEDGVGHLHRLRDEQRWSHESLRSSSRTRPSGYQSAHVHSRSQHHDQSYFVTSTPQSSRAPSPLARYERLVSGLESEAGEAPPSYESIAVRRP